jgi:DNA-binding MarR family transcriptional regulator
MCIYMLGVRQSGASVLRNVWNSVYGSPCVRMNSGDLGIMASLPITLDSARCREIGRSCACYNLRRAARATTRLYDDFLRPSGLRSTQYSMLMAARLRGPVTLTKLAKMTVTERTTLTRNLNILEKKGLVRIEAGEDRRERQVSITRRGQEALGAAIPMWEAAQSHIEQGLRGDRMASLLKCLSEIVSLSREP